MAESEDMVELVSSAEIEEEPEHEVVEPNKKKKPPRYRALEVMQYEKNPKTGEVLWDNPIEIIWRGLNHKSIKKYAFVRHDRDVYSDKDEEQNPERVAGTPKPPHWHIELSMPNSALTIAQVAKWFHVPEQNVYIPKGRDPFLDMVEYITHSDDRQKELGKVLYEDDCITANFDFRQELEDRDERAVRYGRNPTDRQRVRIDLKDGVMTLRDVEREFPQLYVDDNTTLVRMRQKYIAEKAPLPTYRVNIYIEGAGGIGKDIMSQAIARAIIDPDGTMDDTEVFFACGGDNVAFDGYVGQPAVVWSDCRGDTLIRRFGRDETFDIFSTTPTNTLHNIKYGAVRLLNTLNIVNSVESFDDFIKDLSGEYKGWKDDKIHHAEDTSQALRRFPIFIVIHEEDYDMYMNNGFMFNNRDFQTYTAYMGMAGNMRQIANKCGNNMELRRTIEKRTIKPIADGYENAKEKLQHGQLQTDEEILAEFPEQSIPDEPTGERVIKTRLDEETDEGTDEETKQADSDDTFPFPFSSEKKADDDEPFTELDEYEQIPF